MIGSALTKALLEKGYRVIILTRNIEKHSTEENISYAEWDIEKQTIDENGIRKADYIIHLAGENVSSKRWTKNRKKQLIDSRVKTCELLFEKIKEKNKTLKAFITASGTNFYGTITCDKIFTETDVPANDFLGETCQQWEAAADHFKNAGIRTVQIRTGVVLTKHGGALEKIAVCRVNSLMKAVDELHLNGIKVFASEMTAEKNLFDCDFKEPVAVVMGSEEKGVYPALMKICDERIKIPMKGDFESLNVSVAAGIILYEAMKQRM